MQNELETKSLFKYAKSSIAYDRVTAFLYPWECIPEIKNIVLDLMEGLSPEEYDIIDGDIYISKKAKVAKSAEIHGPCIIMEGAEIRQCAFIRGSVLIGRDAVVGNSVELKNCILFDRAQVPHFNYVGDSILGYASHMGAGAITSNLKSDKTKVTVRSGIGKIETGLKKFGAILGDEVEVGCNSVLNPGTVIGRCSNIYPLSSVRGFIPSGCIYKNGGEIVTKK